MSAEDVKTEKERKRMDIVYVRKFGWAYVIETIGEYTLIEHTQSHRTDWVENWRITNCPD